MNIKELIEALEPHIEYNIHNVSREFCSYRGYYKHLAVAESVGRNMSVVSFQNLLANQIGMTYQGYKGGDYTMHEGTELFVSTYGRTGKWVVGIEVDEDGGVSLKTSDTDFNGLDLS